MIIGSRDSPGGWCPLCSYEACALASTRPCQFAEPLSCAPTECSSRPAMIAYHEVSQALFALLREFSPQVEPLSIDEAFLDMTGCEHFYSSLEDMGQTIKDAIRQRLKLSASVGIAGNKFLAKLGSGLQSPTDW